MQALIWHGPRQMVLSKTDKPIPAPREVVVRVEAVGICGSELSGYLGHNSLRVPPLVMGHEFAGVIVTPAAEQPRLAAGTRVAINPLLSCGQCLSCRSGRANLCAQRVLVGAHRPGAFAEYVAVPESACVPLPQELTPHDGALTEPLACAYRAVRLGQVGLASRVLIIGAGTIGLLCAVLARHAGARWVALSDQNPHRLATAQAWGDWHTIDAKMHSAADYLRQQIDSDGADVVIDAVGLEQTRREALAAACYGGRIVFIGLHEPTTSFDGNMLVRNELAITGCFAYTPQDFQHALELLSHKLLPTNEWRHVRRLEDGPASFEELTSSEPSPLKIILTPTP